MPPGFSGNLIFAIIARMLSGNHLNSLLSFGYPRTQDKIQGLWTDQSDIAHLTLKQLSDQAPAVDIKMAREKIIRNFGLDKRLVFPSFPARVC